MNSAFSSAAAPQAMVYVVDATVAEAGSLYGPVLVPMPSRDLPSCNVDVAEDLEVLRGLVQPNALARIGGHPRWWEHVR